MILDVQGPRREPAWGPDMFPTLQAFQDGFIGAQTIHDFAWYADHYDEWSRVKNDPDSRQFAETTMWWRRHGWHLALDTPEVCAMNRAWVKGQSHSEWGHYVERPPLKRGLFWKSVELISRFMARLLRHGRISAPTLSAAGQTGGPNRNWLPMDTGGWVEYDALIAKIASKLKHEFPDDQALQNVQLQDRNRALYTLCDVLITWIVSTESENDKLRFQVAVRRRSVEYQR